MALLINVLSNVDLDITIHRGEINRPVVIFIHGMGMDKNFWLDPLETKVFAKNIPMKVLATTLPRTCETPEKKKLTIGDTPKKINNLWLTLRERGYHLICWSQRRPVGSINAAVEELAEIFNLTVKMYPHTSIALVCHSRGGLIARKFMERKQCKIKALITLSTPHKGSSLPRLVKYVSPISAFLKGLLPKSSHGTVSEILKSVHDFLESKGLKELLPGSEFFKNLKDSPSRGVSYLSFGGHKTKLLTVYKWKKKYDKMYPAPLFAIPDSLIKILPPSIIPDEVIPGRGDFMVTAKSSVLPWTQEHHDLNANHITITWNRKVIKRVIEVLEGI